MNKYEALDIETLWVKDIAKPLCIAITTDEKILFCQNTVKNIENPKILKFLLDSCSSKKIYYVHNLTFEIFVFLPYLIKENLKFKIFSNKRIVYAAEIFYNDKKIILRCSYRLTLLSLKKLAELAEIEEKTEFPYEILTEKIQPYITLLPTMFNSVESYTKFIKKNSSTINTYKILKEYCKNDANITKKSIIKFWKIIEEGGLKNTGKILTAAKLSVTNFYLQKTPVKKKISLKYDRIIRQGYFGGRTEVFGNPFDDELVLHYDWSGMYAQCMCEKVLGGNLFTNDKNLSLKIPGYYWIEFEQNLEYPILPIRQEKLLFANGIFTGWYWFEEILLAIENGVKIRKVEKMIGAEYYDYFLKDFVEINNAIREKSPLHKQIGKNNNNTFYGRLGMNPLREEEEILSDLDLLGALNKYERVEEKNGILIGYITKEKSISNVSISASITSKARIKLYQGMKEVQKNGGRILYTDTDSILAGFPIKNYKNALNKQMGEVYFDSNLKHTIIKDAVFALPKTYALKLLNNDEIVKIKGFNSSPSFEIIHKHFYNNTLLTTTNNVLNKKDYLIKRETIEKTTDLRKLDKRIWKKNLKETSPLYL